MVNEQPVWEYADRHPLSRLYGNVQLLPAHVLGQWICLDRAGGEKRWAGGLHRPNRILGIAGDVIVATETRIDGPWNVDLGCYGISLTSGALRWTAHRASRAGALLVRALDFVPGFANRFRDTPLRVGDTECVCASGRVLDPRTGRTRRVLPAAEVDAMRDAERDSNETEIDPAVRFHRARPVPLRGGGQIRSGTPQAPADENPMGRAGRFACFAEDENGRVLWTFRLDRERHLEDSFYASRLTPPWLYLLVADRPAYVPVGRRDEHRARENPGRYALWSLDTRDGEVHQRIDLGEEPLAECRIEDVDARGLLVSARRARQPRFRLRYYARC